MEQHSGVTLADYGRENALDWYHGVLSGRALHGQRGLDCYPGSEHSNTLRWAYERVY